MAANWDLGAQLGGGFDEAAKASDNLQSLHERIRSNTADEQLKGTQVKTEQGKLDYERDLGNVNSLRETGMSMDDIKNAGMPGYPQQATDLASLKQRVADRYTAQTKDIKSQSDLRDMQAKAWGNRQWGNGGGVKPSLAPLVSRANTLDGIRKQYPDSFTPDMSDELTALNEAINRGFNVSPAGPGATSGALPPAKPGAWDSLVGGIASLSKRLTGGGGTAAAPAAAPAAGGMITVKAPSGATKQYPDTSDMRQKVSGMKGYSIIE